MIQAKRRCRKINIPRTQKTEEIAGQREFHPGGKI